MQIQKGDWVIYSRNNLEDFCGRPAEVKQISDDYIVIEFINGHSLGIIKWQKKIIKLDKNPFECKLLVRDVVSKKTNNPTLTEMFSLEITEIENSYTFLGKNLVGSLFRCNTKQWHLSKRQYA